MIKVWVRMTSWVRAGLRGGEGVGVSECVCVCVSVWVSLRGKERKRERRMCVCVCVCVLAWVPERACVGERGTCFCTLLEDNPHLISYYPSTYLISRWMYQSEEGRKSFNLMWKGRERVRGREREWEGEGVRGRESEWEKERGRGKRGEGIEMTNESGRLRWEWEWERGEDWVRKKEREGCRLRESEKEKFLMREEKFSCQ